MSVMPCAVEAEHHAALQRRGRVVEVEDGAPATRDALVGAPDQGLPRLGEHLDGHVLGNAILLDELAHEVEVRLRGRREADLDFLEAHVGEGLEHVQLAPSVHRIDERLIAVAKVDAAPDRARVIVRPGHCRSGRSIGWNRWYFSIGILFMGSSARCERLRVSLGDFRASVNDAPVRMHVGRSPRARGPRVPKRTRMRRRRSSAPWGTSSWH